MSVVWMVVADEGRARIFERRTAKEPLRELEGFVDPMAHARGPDLADDTQGRFHSPSGGAVHTASPHTGRRELQSQAFAERLMTHLAQAHAQGRFQSLDLAAAPHFLGLLRGVTPTSLHAAMGRQWDKDWCQLDIASLDERLRATRFTQATAP